MVLLVQGRFLQTSPASPKELHDQFPHLLRGAQELAAKPAKRIEPQGVLYVRQKQWGVTHRGDTLEDGHEVSLVVRFSQLDLMPGAWLWNRRCAHLPCDHPS